MAVIGYIKCCQPSPLGTDLSSPPLLLLFHSSLLVIVHDELVGVRMYFNRKNQLAKVRIGSRSP